MVVHCEQVWREISNYLDDDVDPNLRAAMEAHFGECERCRSVLEGTRNVIQLYGDERMNEVPLGFGNRLQRRLAEDMRPTRRRFLGWVVAAAAAVLVGGAIELGRYSTLWRHGSGVPPDMMVVVSTDRKMFHVPGCPLISDKTHIRNITAREAEKEGYAPCPVCLKKYLRTGLDAPEFPSNRPS